MSGPASKAPVTSARKEYAQANYARLEPDDATVVRLFDFCVENRLGLVAGDGWEGVTAEDFKFHVTLMYSAVVHPSFRDASFDVDPIRLTPKGFRIFGLDAPRLALEFELDDALRTLFGHYREAFGHRPDFDPFRPHLTIRGSGGQSIPGLPAPGFPVIANRIVHEVR